jgi:two-component system NtrC family sensor kinase
MREAEVVSAVERALMQVRASRERETLARQLRQTNNELQQRVRELTTIFAIGKAVTSITDQRELFEKIVEGAIYVTEADCGWLLLREDHGRVFNLAAQRNLPKTVASRINQPWDDGISSLVALSGEPLSISGEPLARFKVSQFGQAALAVPVNLKKEVVGLLTVVRKVPNPFNSSNKTLLEAVADYASISLVNASLFHALEERARMMQQAAEAAQASDKRKEQALAKFKKEIGQEVAGTLQVIDSILVGEDTRLNATQKSMLRSALDNLHTVSAKLEE